MGCAVSCFRTGEDNDDEEEGENPEALVAFRNCICLRCSTLAEQLYSVLFQSRDANAASSSLQGITSLSRVELDSSISDSYRAPPRPLPYDDPRCSRLHCQRVGLVARGDKASSHAHEESELLRGRNIFTEYAGTAYNLNASDCEEQSKTRLSVSSLKFPSKAVTSRVAYIFASSEDEDVCPTCLEEYTSENPRITLQCSHQYHLSCIYEWMERSEACPVCGKIAVFLCALFLCAVFYADASHRRLSNYNIYQAWQLCTVPFVPAVPRLTASCP